jgi:hypothetical protein
MRKSRPTPLGVLYNYLVKIAFLLSLMIDDNKKLNNIFLMENRAQPL